MKRTMNEYFGVPDKYGAFGISAVVLGSPTSAPLITDAALQAVGQTIDERNSTVGATFLAGIRCIAEALTPIIASRLQGMDGSAAIAPTMASQMADAVLNVLNGGFKPAYRAPASTEDRRVLSEEVKKVVYDHIKEAIEAAQPGALGKAYGGLLFGFPGTVGIIYGIELTAKAINGTEIKAEDVTLDIASDVIALAALKGLSKSLLNLGMAPELAVTAAAKIIGPIAVLLQCSVTAAPIEDQIWTSAHPPPRRGNSPVRDGGRSGGGAGLAPGLGLGPSSIGGGSDSELGQMTGEQMWNVMQSFIDLQNQQAPVSTGSTGGLPRHTPRPGIRQN